MLAAEIAFHSCRPGDRHGGRHGVRAEHVHRSDPALPGSAHRAPPGHRGADHRRLLGRQTPCQRRSERPQGPHRLERAGNLANLRAAASAAPAESGFRGDFPFQDSDVHKWLEAASWQLADGGEGPAEEELARQVERLAGLVTSAQAEDGYLQTYYQLGPDARRWAEPHWGHELYCAGHLLQAAVAHHRATGADGLLDVAVRCADLVDATFGPGRNETVCGHPEIETALVELYRETGERRYLDLAGYFVDRRGQGSLGDGPADGSPGPRPGAPYWQDHIPVREATAVAGHAVRQLYLLAGAADVAAETGNAGLRDALVRLGRTWPRRRPI
ncbi:hypothetical protein GCM10017744_007990 [Streptomyces antimycoticus]